MDNSEQQEVYVKIPAYRIGALIGKNGFDKKEIENLTGAELDIDSKTGDVTIIRQKADPFTFYRLEQVVKAIGRGFSPMHAKLLLEPDYYLDIIDLKEAGIKSERGMETKKGRVIGSYGSMRKFIEDSFDCNVSVQGKTISVIAKIGSMQGAINAIDSLISGMNIEHVKKQIQKEVVKSSINNESNEEF